MNFVVIANNPTKDGFKKQGNKNEQNAKSMREKWKDKIKEQNWSPGNEWAPWNRWQIHNHAIEKVPCIINIL